MEKDMEAALAKLQLTEEEEETFVCDVGVDDTRANEIALCLIGKLNTDQNFNSSIMKTVMKNAWKPVKGMVIRDLDKNLFAFQFFAPSDKEWVLNEGPWAFDGHILLLKQMNGLEQPSEISFVHARFWVKAYDIPPLMYTNTFAAFLGSKIGVFVGTEESELCGVDRSLNFRVEVDISKPLRRGVKVVIDGKARWISIKYNKLPDFCYLCGKVGHVLKTCEAFEEGLEEEKLQYGAWMRAFPIPMKSKRKGREAEMAEEKKLFLAFKGVGNGGESRKKLYFTEEKGGGVEN